MLSTMFTLLDVNKIVLPKFVALNRIPVVAGSQAVQSNVTKLTDTVEQSSAGWNGWR